jgi:hypothetical protein
MVDCRLNAGNVQVMEKTNPGETGQFLRGRRRFVSQAVPEIEPIPLRPPEFFAHAASPADIRDGNRLAKASVIRTPKDLE